MKELKKDWKAIVGLIALLVGMYAAANAPANSTPKFIPEPMPKGVNLPMLI